MGLRAKLSAARQLYTHPKKDRAYWAVAHYHFGVWTLGVRNKPLRWFLSKLYGLGSLWVQMTSGIVIDRHTKIGERFHIIHAGTIYIHPDVVIGDRCGLMHGVTLGTNQGRGVPTIGDDVFIGAHATVVGAIRIGHTARIAANTLVTRDVPDGCTAIGVPARIYRRADKKWLDDSPEATRDEDAELAAKARGDSGLQSS